MTERGDLVSVVEKYSDMQTKKRKLMSEMEEMERIHGDKNKIRQEQTERAGNLKNDYFSILLISFGPYLLPF